MKEARTKLTDARKKVERRELEENGEIKVVKQRLARTGRGKGLLRICEVSKEDIQDKEKPMVIVGGDVESLYPPFEDKAVADIVYKAMIETEIKVHNIYYKETVRYIALN